MRSRKGSARDEKRSTRRSGLGGRGRKRLKFLAGFETYSFAGRDIYLLPRPRITPDPGLARLHVEYAKAPQFDPSSAAQRVFHGLEDGLNRLLGLGSINVCFLYDGVYDIELYHNFLREFVVLDRNSMLDRGLQVVKHTSI
jgi:hypothetical protein